MATTTTRIESELEVLAYLQDLKYVLPLRRDSLHARHVSLQRASRSCSKMNTLKIERRLCPCCMEGHDVQTILVKESNVFKGVPVEYDAAYFYCDRAKETLIN